MLSGNKTGIVGDQSAVYF